MALYTKKELTPQTLAALKKLATQHDIDKEDYSSKAELIDQLLKVSDEVEEEELEKELEEELAEEEEDIDLDEEPELDDEEDELSTIKAELDAEIDASIAEGKAAAAKRTNKASTAKTPAKKSTKAASTADGDTLAAKQVATLVGTEPKTLRQFLRSDASTFEAVGSGGRYEFTEGDVPKIKEEFDAWKSAHASRGTKRGTTKAAKPAAEELEEVEEIEELEEDFEDLEEDELELEEED